MDNHITFDDLFSADLYTAKTLAERNALLVSQAGNEYARIRDTKERYNIVFTAHLFATMATVLRNGGMIDGQKAVNAQIAKALCKGVDGASEATTQKRLTLVSQIIENGAPFTALVAKKSGRFVLADRDVAAHIVKALEAETGGRSVETLHKLYGKPVVEPTPPTTDEQTDDTVTTDDDTDGFNLEAALLTVMQASHKRDISRDDVLAAMVAAVEAVYGKA